MDKDKEIKSDSDEEMKTLHCKNPAEWHAQALKRFEPGYQRRCPTSSVSIYRVPKPMFSLKPQCYLPQIVSLGPYHCKMNPELSLMEEYKIEAVRRTLERIRYETADDLMAQVEQWEDEIRESYEEAIDINRETLACMFTMDACFILEFFKSHCMDSAENDVPFSLVFRSWRDENIVTQEILRDILKLENQLPLFVLKRILALEFVDPDEALEDLVRPLMTWVTCFDICNESMCAEHIKNASHLLDLLHKTTEHFFVDSLSSADSDDISRDKTHCTLSLNGGLSCLSSPTCSRGTLDKEKTLDYPIHNLSAGALEKSGINITLSKTGKIYLEKKGFGRSSNLYLPRIRITDNTEPMLLNLMAFEACKMHHLRLVITRFVCFFVFLITSRKDVALLTQEKVIVNFMGSDEKAAAIFKDMCDQTSWCRIEELEVVLEQVAEHHNSRVNLWISQFKEKYFSQPWSILALLGSLILLALTLAQTIYSAKSARK